MSFDMGNDKKPDTPLFEASQLQ
ncbi:hypothetical protein VCRA2119O147_1790006 [Vibrio crassostreae]|nr:hypothetical protein VCRA2113O212_340019 [Vibrio crassostreae]CAK2078293.1 hypothetical protein VCRA2113O193_380018 [Vibrio crassostreae]CAK2113028.1 hypothetical protein VCRA2110O175_400018 [Vibrio crassostreae]CAK2119856.1 hypothetical protein VCRA2110O173_490007 [Vibrio crassostreae]CAK2140380.1 hypothetical protein VCRA2113O200_450019 [Vibrio crassostreae]